MKRNNDMQIFIKAIIYIYCNIYQGQGIKKLHFTFIREIILYKYQYTKGKYYNAYIFTPSEV